MNGSHTRALAAFLEQIPEVDTEYHCRVCDEPGGWWEHNHTTAEVEAAYEEDER